MTKVVAKFNDRLNEALEKRNIRPVDLANKADIPEATISQYRSGYAKPKYERIVKIADALNVSLAWLMGGDVPMERTRKAPGFLKLNPSGPSPEPLSDQDLEKLNKAMELYQTFENLPPDKQTEFVNFLKFLQSES